jgi:hypothetical protein
MRWFFGFSWSLPASLPASLPVCSSGVSIELVPSVYLSSELIVIDTQTVDRCHVNQVSCLFQGTVLEPSTSHIGQGVALVTQAAAPVYPVYISTFPSQIAEMITHSRTEVLRNNRPGVLHLTYLVLPVNRLHLVATT